MVPVIEVRRCSGYQLRRVCAGDRRLLVLRHLCQGTTDRRDGSAPAAADNQCSCLLTDIDPVIARLLDGDDSIRRVQLDAVAGWELTHVHGRLPAGNLELDEVGFLVLNSHFGFGAGPHEE